MLDVEEELFKRIHARVKGDEDEAQVVTKSFRLFDANGNGTVCFPEFSRAIRNFGIMAPERQL
jgi:Ca2+-binding EF-hand superfamily protein